MKKLIDNYFKMDFEALNSIDKKELSKVMCLLIDCLYKNRRIYVFGNGGSGSTASHLQNDFNKALFEKTDKKFDVICLNDNIPTLLAIANDEGYDEIFRYQLDGKIKKDDVVIAISGSGNSKNIINAVMLAKECGATVIGMTGFDGGILKTLADYNLHAKINNMQVAEDVHLCLEHLIINTFYERFGKRKYKKLERRKDIE